MSKITARLEINVNKVQHPKPPFLAYINNDTPDTFLGEESWQGVPVLVTKVYISGSSVCGVNYRVYRIDGGCLQKDSKTCFTRSISIDSKYVTPLFRGRVYCLTSREARI